MRGALALLRVVLGLHVVVARERNVVGRVRVQLDGEELQEATDVRSTDADEGDVDRADDRVTLPADEPRRSGEQAEHGRREAERDHEGGLAAELAGEELVDARRGDPGTHDEREAEEHRRDEEQNVHVHFLQVRILRLNFRVHTSKGTSHPGWRAHILKAIQIQSRHCRRGNRRWLRVALGFDLGK